MLKLGGKTIHFTHDLFERCVGTALFTEIHGLSLNVWLKVIYINNSTARPYWPLQFH